MTFSRTLVLLMTAWWAAADDHWSWQPLKRQAMPDNSRYTNPIDAFITAKLRPHKLSLAPEADRRTLIRRLTFNLTGLPPAPAEVEAFLKETDPNAYEKLIDRLLTFPAYGEHWAQHWLDLARFAETDGFEHDKVRPNAWRYRDWLVGALNADLPYDQFVLHQLAGDTVSAEATPATGFLLAGQDMPDINLNAERRHMVLNEMTATVFKHSGYPEEDDHPVFSTKTSGQDTNIIEFYLDDDLANAGHYRVQMVNEYGYAMGSPSVLLTDAINYTPACLYDMSPAMNGTVGYVTHSSLLS